MRYLLLVAVLSASCAGIRVGTLEPPRSGGLQIESVPAPTSIVLLTSGDAIVNSDPEWSDKNLGDEDWLMAGASPARGAYWFTYLQFDLSVLPVGATYSSAVLDLPTLVTSQGGALNLHVVEGQWDSETLTWDEQPRVQEDAVARLRQGGCLADCADLTRLVNSEVSAERESLSLVVVPARPWELGFHRWNSSETFDDASAFTDTLPRMTFIVGEPPPAASAAELDRLRGIE